MVGTDPADGAEIVALNGRYGPYIKKGAETRSLESEEQLFTITLEDALALLAAPKARRGQRQASASPLKELGPDPDLREGDRDQGRSLRPVRHGRRDECEPAQQDAIESLTLERALELLAERRAKGPSPARSAPRRARNGRDRAKRKGTGRKRAS